MTKSRCGLAVSMVCSIVVSCGGGRLAPTPTDDSGADATATIQDGGSGDASEGGVSATADVGSASANDTGAPFDAGAASLTVRLLPQQGVDKVDLLFMIDNSASMGDKQALLADAVPDIVNRLVSPNCVDRNGHILD